MIPIFTLFRLLLVISSLGFVFRISIFASVPFLGPPLRPLPRPRPSPLSAAIPASIPGSRLGAAPDKIHGKSRFAKTPRTHQSTNTAYTAFSLNTIKQYLQNTTDVASHSVPVTGPGPSPAVVEPRILLVLLPLRLGPHAVRQLPETLLELDVLALPVLQLVHLGVEELGGDPAVGALGGVQHPPQLSHEHPRVLPVEESGQVDLHLPWIRKLKYIQLN